jgi:hypothetical protein
METIYREAQTDNKKCHANLELDLPVTTHRNPTDNSSD